MKKVIIVSLVSLFLTACGLSPQVIHIDPELTDAKGIPAPSGTTFDLSVTDTRPSPVLGPRGGVYKETAVLKTDGDITGKIKQKLVDSFKQAGFTIDSSSNTRMNVNVVKLHYRGYGENRISEVEVGAEILATVTRPGGKFSKTYKASRKKEVLKAPGDEKNEEMINEIFGAVVQRVLDDEELLGYIKGL